MGTDIIVQLAWLLLFDPSMSTLSVLASAGFPRRAVNETKCTVSFIHEESIN